MIWRRSIDLKWPSTILPKSKSLYVWEILIMKSISPSFPAANQKGLQTTPSEKYFVFFDLVKFARQKKKLA